MPYCPKCDMEYVEGISTCSDCGDPLVKSKEAYEREHVTETAGNDVSESRPDVNLFRHSETYESTSSKYENLKSSASAFFMVGGLILVMAVGSFAGIIPLPFYGPSRILIHGVMTTMGILFVSIGFKSSRTAKSIHCQIAVEEEKTQSLIHWFLAAYKAETIDGSLSAEFGELSGEELVLKRMERIYDHLVTAQDLPNEAYVDELCEQIYSRLYETE